MAVPHIEMDALFWKPNWQESANDEFFPKLESHLQAQRWVLDGNYSRTAHITWCRVDMVIWLDYGFGRRLYQSLSRTLNHIISKQELWVGTNNIETFRQSFFSRDSVVLYMIQNYRKIRQNYLYIMQAEQFAHIRFVRLTSPKAAKNFLQQFKA